MTIPYDIESEYRLLGGCMQSFEWANQTVQTLNGSHFFCPKNRLIFATIKDLYEKDRTVSFDVLEALMPKESVPLDHLVKVSMLGSTALEIKDLLEFLKELAVKRQIHEMGPAISKAAEDKASTSESIIRSFEQKLFSLSDPSSKSSVTSIKGALLSPRPFTEILQERQDSFRKGISSYRGMPTHFYDLDSKIKGLTPGHFTIVGARPGVGKTTFALNLIEQICFKSKSNCMFFSLEMPRGEVVEKLMAQTAEIPYAKVREGDLTGEEYQRLVSVCHAWQSKTLLIDDQPSLAIDQLKSRAIRAKRTDNINAIFIDYIQLVTSKNKEARHLEVADISRRCKEIAKELDVAIIALAQLNRDVEKREKKEPYISDLRESGGLEADADEILLLHRPDMYNEYEKPNLMQIFISKNRFGETGTIFMNFDKKCGVLKNYSKLVSNADQY